MTAPVDPAHPDHFPLARILILILAGAFFGLMCDIRVEHVEVVRERPIAWTPIIYSGFMSMACLAAFFVWSKRTRQVMLPLFLLAFVVGGLGFYFHNHGNLMDAVKTSINAWTNPAMDHPDGPPKTAPLAFAGLGLIGVLASLGRFNS